MSIVMVIDAHLSAFYDLWTLYRQIVPARTVQTSGSVIVINDLSLCQAYFVTVTAANCMSRQRSDVTLIDVRDAEQFRATIILENNEPCNVWITSRIEQKRDDAQSFVLEALMSACSYSIPCAVNTTFSCPADDSSKVNFM